MRYRRRRAVPLPAPSTWRDAAPSCDHWGEYDFRVKTLRTQADRIGATEAPAPLLTQLQNTITSTRDVHYKFKAKGRGY